MKIYKYGDNVDTDVIIPARYLNSFDAKELASHAMVILILILLKRLNRVILLLLEKILVAVLQENMLLYV